MQFGPDSNSTIGEPSRVVFTELMFRRQSHGDATFLLWLSWKIDISRLGLGLSPPSPSDMSAETLRDQRRYAPLATFVEIGLNLECSIGAKFESVPYGL